MLPIAEKISCNLLATLAGVSIAAGYQVNLRPVRYAKRPPVPSDLLAILHEGDDEALPDSKVPLGFSGWIRPYAVQVYRMVPEDAATPYATLLSTVRADIEKAVMADPSRGQWADRTEIAGPVEFEEAGDASGVIVCIKVHYRTLFQDPYSKT